MTLAELLPYISAAIQLMTLVAGAIAFLRVQSAQHQANISRLDQLTDRVKAVEDIGRRQTDILIGFGRIEERVDGHDHRIGQLENRDAGRRIAAKGG